MRLARRFPLPLRLCSNPALGHRSSASPVAKKIETSKIDVDFRSIGWSAAWPKTSPQATGSKTEPRSGSLAAAAGNLRLGTGAGSGPVVPTLTSMTASTAAAGPGLREICDDLVLRGHRLAVEDVPKSCVHLRGHLGEVHRGERLGAPGAPRARCRCHPQRAEAVGPAARRSREAARLTRRTTLGTLPPVRWEPQGTGRLRRTWVPPSVDAQGWAMPRTTGPPPSSSPAGVCSASRAYPGRTVAVP